MASAWTDIGCRRLLVVESDQEGSWSIHSPVAHGITSRGCSVTPAVASDSPIQLRSVVRCSSIWHRGDGVCQAPRFRQCCEGCKS